MPILTKLKDFLDAKHVGYEVRSHQGAFPAQEVAAAQHVRRRKVAKLVSLGAATGRNDLRLATEVEIAGLLPGCEPGAMPPFTQDEDIFFNAGNHEQTVHLAYADFARLGTAEDRVFRHGRPVE